MNKVIYLDYAAATPLDPKVLVVMKPYFSEKFYNPSAIYLAAKKVSKDIEEARAKVAKWLGARPSEIIFTAGGTEANNLAVQGVMQAFPGCNVVVSAIEHESVLAPASRYEIKKAPVNKEGIIDLVKLEKLINDRTSLVSVIYANNEIGTIQPLREIAQLINKIKKQRQKKGIKLPLYFHTDACQAGVFLDLHVNRLGVDMMTLNGGKIYGPKQSGGLYVKTGTQLQAQILGGGQEQGIRSGTENVANIIGFATALDLVQRDCSQKVKQLQKLFFELLEKQVPNTTINGALTHRLPNNVHVTITDQDNERLLMELDERGILCAAGSACSASNEEPSHVLKAIGLTDKQAQSSLRFSLGRDTTDLDIKKTVETMAEIING